MIKAYVVAFSTLYEGEDIELRYCIVKEGQKLQQESGFLDYVKPSVVSGSAVLAVLAKLEAYKDEAITIFIKDDALYEIIRGTSTSKKGEVLKMASKLKKEIAKFSQLSFNNISNKDKTTLAEWKAMLEF